MKKVFKIIVFIFMIVFMTGCSATYNVTIEDSTIVEDLTVENDFSSNQIKAYIENVVPVSINVGCFIDYDQDDIKNTERIPTVNYYDITSKKDTELNATSTVYLNEYKNSRIANSLFNKININNYEDKISIYGFNGLVAFDLNPELESVTVNITVKDKKVITNDADKVNNNTYTWIFNRSTNNSKTLYLEMERIKQQTQQQQKKERKSFAVYIIIFIFILSCIALIVLKIKEKKNKSS